jgi:hypothetical protein
LHALEEAGVRERLVGEVGKRDHVVHARLVAQGAHLDPYLGGLFGQGAPDLGRPLDDGVGEFLGGVFRRGPVLVFRDLLGRDGAHPEAHAGRPAARDERDDER